MVERAFEHRSSKQGKGQIPAGQKWCATCHVPVLPTLGPNVELGGPLRAHTPPEPEPDELSIPNQAPLPSRPGIKFVAQGTLAAMLFLISLGSEHQFTIAVVMLTQNNSSPYAFLCCCCWKLQVPIYGRGARFCSSAKPADPADS